MPRLSAIEEWFYGLSSLEFDDDPERRFTRRSRTRTSLKDQWSTSSTTVYTFDRTMARAMGVKMVADELLAATGAVLGGAAAIVTSPGAFGLGIHSGEQFGRSVGDFMWKATNFFMDDRSLSQKWNKGQSYGPKGYRPQSWV